MGCESSKEASERPATSSSKRASTSTTNPLSTGFRSILDQPFHDWMADQPTTFDPIPEPRWCYHYEDLLSDEADSDDDDEGAVIRDGTSSGSEQEPSLGFHSFSDHSSSPSARCCDLSGSMEFAVKGSWHDASAVYSAK